MHTASPVQTQNENTKEIIAVYCENNMKPINIIYGKITEVFTAKAWGSFN